MEIKDYLAKPNQTIEEHGNESVGQLDILLNYGYIDSTVYKLARPTCEHHDDGKANEECQKRLKSNGKLKFNREKEISHNILSGFLLKRDEFDSDDDYYTALFAILYHHNYDDPYETIINRKDKIYELLDGFEIQKITRRTLNNVQMKMEDDFAIKLKGILNKCDYSASGGYQIEYPNDFLVDSLENVKEKWKRFNPESDWNDLQKFCIEKRNENIMAVAQTGAGKTEGGLLWIGNNKGFFVLPLRAAINAIYERTRHDILLNENIDSRLSVLHSESLEYYLQNSDIGEEDLMEYEYRGKRLSMPLSISTMDQLFDFVFKYQGSEVKLATLSYSRVVIDEIQMYDAELLAYLIYGLKRITEMGGKVAILTATLSPFVKDLLRKEIDFSDDNIKVFINGRVRHNVKCLNRKINASDIYMKYKSNKNKKILVVCNTIKKAQKIYRDLEKMMKQNDDLDVLHGKFTRQDKAVKEKEILEFGKTYDDQGNIDTQSGIWISTSYVEASLDIDFDILFTELQDLSSLFQRFGRVNRKGVKDISVPNCYVYLDIDINLLTDNGGFIDSTIYRLSKEAMKTVDGKLSEQDKLNLLDEYLTMDNIKDSEYYRCYKDTIEWIKGITVYEYSKDNNRLRNIISKDVIPGPVYEKNKDEIHKWESVLKEGNANKIEKVKAKEEILKFSVSIPGYEWDKYSKARFKGKAKSYPSIFLSTHQRLDVIECIYDELGFQSMSWK